MGENNSHIESIENRIERFRKGPPVEIIDTLLNSIDNFFNNEIKITPSQLQTSLMFLGVHAVALTISEALFGQRGEQGYKTFLEEFTDDPEDPNRFSLIATEIHNWRNILAHQWLGVSGHTIGYDYLMLKGWERREGMLFINPEIYCKQYLDAFRGRIWRYKDKFNEAELERIKQRILDKFLSS